MERDRALKIMNITAAVLFGLTVLLYLFVTAYPRGVMQLFMQKSDIELSTAAIVHMLLGAVKPLIFTAVGVIGFTRKNMSFKWSMATAVGSGILWLFPPAFLKMYFTSAFASMYGAEELAYISALNSSVAMFGFMSSIGILLIFGSAVAEAYAAKKGTADK
ncbi:MAG: hypothetical protein J6B75_04790 [Ruminococcus sp.]|nr:hypothetical protein [Ruminococcus sp.]